MEASSFFSFFSKGEASVSVEASGSGKVSYFGRSDESNSEWSKSASARAPPVKV